MFKHLLVPTDGSALSEEAIRMAVSLARKTGAKVTGLHVVPEYHLVAYGPEMVADTTERFAQVVQQHAEAYLRVIAQAAEQAGVVCDTAFATRAHPYEGIISTAEQRNCDLIVMASHGRGGVRGRLIGSETQKVLTHGKIPVLVVRPSAEATPRGEAVSGASAPASQRPGPHPFIIARVSLTARL
jgi:nucleotide-binding universal stress UspA family protein